MPTTKSTKPATAAKKPRAPRKKAAAAEVKEPQAVQQEVAAVETPAVTVEKPVIPQGKYIFATGRRKSAVANVRMFSGKGETVVNKKPLKDYFQFKTYAEEVIRPFEVTGLLHDFHCVCTLTGGGSHAQVGALKHGFAIAISKLNPETRKVLKKNGFLTRDPREKERKKPGLKRARRSPQWAKR